MEKLLKMFFSFFKIGAFTFGGGYAMIPLIEEEVVNKNKWIEKEEFMDMLVISQSFPGALAINCSTFIGYKLGGMIGGIIAILGVTLPSFIIILFVATFIASSFLDISVVYIVIVAALIGIISDFVNSKRGIKQ